MKDQIQDDEATTLIDECGHLRATSINNKPQNNLNFPSLFSLIKTSLFNLNNFSSSSYSRELKICEQKKLRIEH